MDLVKIDFNGWLSLLTVNLRPKINSWNFSTHESGRNVYTTGHHLRQVKIP